MERLAQQCNGGRVVASSAGTEPAPEVNPFALRALREIGIRHEGARPKTAGELSDEEFDLAVTVCDNARESCPVLPGAPRTIHVGYPDPAAAEGTEGERLEAFRLVRDSMAAWTEFIKAILD